MTTKPIISRATLERMPLYLRYLTEKEREGFVSVSSTLIAEDLGFSAIQVRKDLSSASLSGGKPKTGFEIRSLISDITSYLGFNNVNEAVLVGVGKLGKTLLSYDGFRQYGLSIVAAFDKNPEVVGSEINGKKVFSTDEMENIIAKSGIKMGVITVPKAYAQEVADLLISAGIKAIWNFAPTSLNIPEGIALKNEDMAASLAVLSKRLTDILKKENQ